MLIIERTAAIKLNARLATPTDSGFMSLFVLWSWRILIPVSILQCLCWSTPANFFAVAVVLFAWKLTTAVLLPLDIFSKYPLSSFVVLGYSLTQFYFPLLFTLIEYKPIVFNLNLPYDVFIHSLLGFITLLLSHQLYQRLNRRNRAGYNNALQTLLWKTGLFKPPSDWQIWLIGFAGMFSMFFSGFGKMNGQEYSGSGNKFIEGFIYFAYAPYFLLLPGLYKNRLKKITKRLLIQLVVFTVLVFIISIIRNCRSAFMFGFTGLAYSYMIGLFLHYFKPVFFTRKNLLLGVAAIFLITGPLSKLATAMLVAREQRNSAGAVELLQQTLEAYKNNDALAAYKETYTGLFVGEFDETYLDNLFLARFCTLKYNDLSLTMAQKIGGIDPQLKKYAIERSVATLPQPVLNVLGIEMDKEKLLSYSIGDYFIDRVGWQNELGGYNIGHFAGYGMASFGWWYLAFLFILMVPAFFLWDAMTVVVRPSSGSQKKVIFSFCGLLFMIFSLQFISFENVLAITEFLIRNWLQMIVLYLLLFHSMGLLLQLSFPRRI